MKALEPSCLAPKSSRKICVTSIDFLACNPLWKLHKPTVKIASDARPALRGPRMSQGGVGVQGWLGGGGPGWWVEILQLPEKTCWIAMPKQFDTC